MEIVFSIIGAILLINILPIIGLLVVMIVPAIGASYYLITTTNIGSPGWLFSWVVLAFYVATWVFIWWEKREEQKKQLTAKQ